MPQHGIEMALLDLEQVAARLSIPRAGSPASRCNVAGSASVLVMVRPFPQLGPRPQHAANDGDEAFGDELRGNGGRIEQPLEQEAARECGAERAHLLARQPESRTRAFGEVFDGIGNDRVPARARRDQRGAESLV
jgi:hypothetical protein